jgi:hypothetical protein
MDALGSLGDWFGSSGGKGLLDLLGLGATGAGLVGNIATERARSGELNTLKQAQKAASDPTLLAKEVAAATQPLSSGLTQDVGNVVSGSLAERGLSQAPGIQGTELATALAPFYQQNQNTALQLVLEKLGIPIQAAQAYLQNLPSTVNLSPLVAMLMKGGMFGSPSTGAPATPSPPQTMDWTFGGSSGITPPPATDTGGGSFDMGAFF